MPRLWVGAVLLLLLLPPVLPAGSQDPGPVSLPTVSLHLARFIGEQRGRAGGLAELLVHHSGDEAGAAAAVESAGFEVLRRYHALPVIAVRGPAAGVDALLRPGPFTHIEPNLPAVQDMEVSTSAINATRVWYRDVLGAELRYSNIDGKGVTVAVVDTGIDAGHPDLDYGIKVVRNVYDSGGIWIDMENSDTNYGHGTHVAGTVAGNGDASAGARRGVAPGANLIGVTVNMADTKGYLAGLEWVYDHSRPGSNTYNIRVATNSWHTSVGEYDPDSALSQIIEKLAYENNVVTTWSAGNDGRDDPEGNTITTSQQGNTPVAVMVAAYARDGTEVADFSSRGQRGLNHTYPSVGGPGVRIWSTSARRTVISAGTYTGGNTNPYYLAISGTSMSTPHIAGLSALLWQAAPSLKVSERHQDFSGNDTGWWSNPRTRIHEVEWILHESAGRLPSDAEHGVPAPDNATGYDGRPIDYVQGYGFVDADRAVGIALTLQRLRDIHPDRNITVPDALRTYRAVMNRTVFNTSSGELVTGWTGEYSRYNDQAGKPLSAVNQTKLLTVPEGAEKAVVEMRYTPFDLQEAKAGDITYTIDTNGDGSADTTGPTAPSRNGVKRGEYPVSADQHGSVWRFDVIGEALKVQRPLKGEKSYVEARVGYSMSLRFIMNSSAARFESPVNISAMEAPLVAGDPGADGRTGNLSVNMSVYDLTKAVLPPPKRPSPPAAGGFPWWLAALPLAAAVPVAGYLRRRRNRKL